MIYMYDWLVQVNGVFHSRYHHAVRHILVRVGYTHCSIGTIALELVLKFNSVLQ